LSLLVQLDLDIHPQHLRGPITFCSNVVTTIIVFIIIFIVAFAPTAAAAAVAAAAVPGEPTKRADLLRVALRRDGTVRVCLRAGPRAAPAPAEEGEAWVGAVVREDAGAELRVVCCADDVRCCAAHEVYLLFVWLCARASVRLRAFSFF